MPAIGDAEVIVLEGLWVDEDGAGVDGTITLDPVLLTGQSGTTPNLKDLTSYSHIQTKRRVASPDPTTGYYAVLALSSNDPDVDPYGGRRVTFTGYDPYVIQVPYNAPTKTVDARMAAATGLSVGSTVRALWLIDAPDGSNPPTPVDSYYTADQTNSVIATAIAGVSGGGGGSSSLVPTTVFTSNSHVPASGEMARYNPSSSWSLTLGAAASGQRFGMTNVASTGSNTATFTCAGSDTFSDGTTSLTLAPGERVVLIGATGGFTIESRTIVPAGGGNYTDEQVRDVMGTALVQGSGISITVNDPGDTITIAATGGGGSSYTDEQAQDVVAALFAAGTDSGIAFTYNDAGNALSATVSAQAWTQITGKPSFSAVATSGSASDLSTGTVGYGRLPVGTGSSTVAAGDDQRIVNAASTALALALVLGG